MFRVLAGLTVAAALGACAQQDEESGPLCPNIIIVKDTSEYTAFKPGPGRDLTDVVMEARLDRFSGFCETDLDRDRSGEVTLDLRLIFQATRGPASTSRAARFPFFVAIADREGNILAKEIFESEFEFEGNRTRIGVFEDLTPEIPLAPGQTGEDFDIFVGFQLTGEQLDYTRSRNVR